MEINSVDSTISMLANMSPQQRQQFAAMHHDDPYMMSLASFVSNTIQSYAQAQQRNQVMQQQMPPPVVEQEIAAMAPPEQMPPEMAGGPLPEEVGIGALPAPNLAQMADGGIVGGYDDYDMGVGYAEGGMVERYQVGGDTRSQFMRDVMSIPERYTQWWEQNRAADAIKAAAEKESAARRAAQSEASQKGSFFNYLFGTPKREEEGRKELAQLAATAPKEESWKDPAAWAKFEADLSAQVQAGVITEQTKQGLLADAEKEKIRAPKANLKAPAAQAPAPAPGAAPTADTGRKPAVPTPTKQTADDMVQQYQTLMTKLKADDPAAAQRAELAALIEGRGRADLEELVKTQKSGAERLKGREERYAAQEAKLAKSADTNTGLALLMAAGAVLEGRGLGQGLARAAKVAIPQYQEGLAKMQAAQERINEGRDRLEELRQNYDDLNAKEIRAAKRQIHDDLITAKKLGIDGIMAAQGVKEKQAATIFDGLVRNQITDLAGQYSVSAAAARGSETSDIRLAQLATNIRTKANEAADKQYLQGPARAQFIEAEIAKYAQSVPGLAEYMGVTGGGGVPLPQGVTVRKVGD